MTSSVDGGGDRGMCENISFREVRGDKYDGGRGQIAVETKHSFIHSVYERPLRALFRKINPKDLVNLKQKFLFNF